MPRDVGLQRRTAICHFLRLEADHPGSSQRTDDLCAHTDGTGLAGLLFFAGE